MYHFISGYTAKVAGTEVGIMSRKQLSRLLRKSIFTAAPHTLCRNAGRKNKNQQAKVWLVNTG
jgi:phosphoenolpyruvate carboxykinase (ATP)